ncbi:uncharacterized protein N7506_000136 [Penicillium brevicompactum]|uniref:uncharacterized protein n=1 Tax=Penicillium brevicompactum TaxID=5074 RepID=UPI0025413B10|nr:uncharacterized protein N7506_000136 [Penicillium brevicompactum]KAJ5346883.1 hypothetical protein N7506_000136 [Penicillium brevicompactum]
MSLTREKCGSVQALGAEIRKIHAEKVLLHPDCVSSEIERTLFFVNALGPEDANGNITKAAPTFDYIENKAIEEEHRKGQLSKQPTEAHALPALAIIRGPGDEKVVPSADGTTCRIEIDNVPYCSLCRKPYHVDSECFSKNPRPRDQKKDGKSHKSKPGNSHTGARKPLKRRPTSDDEGDDVGGPRDPKKPTKILARNCSNRSLPLQPVAVIKAQHDSVPSLVPRQARPITTQIDRIQMGILDPTQAEEEAHRAKNQAMHSTRL